MKEYGSCDLRNIAILAHGKAGKTSLTEALAYNAGHTNRLGRVDDGTTVADFEPEEIKRKLTISNALVSCEWEDTKLNFIDTPGYPDFFGEVKGALSATDSALIVVCAPAGIEVETEKVWNYCKALNKPTAFLLIKWIANMLILIMLLNNYKLSLVPVLCQSRFLSARKKLFMV